MKRGLQGTELLQHVPGEPYRAFVPFDLPPNPPLVLDGRLSDALERANRALGRLDGLGLLIPDLSLFLYYYVRKEAVLSSQIEGTQSSLSDLLLFESDAVPGVPLDDVTEVSRYVAALNYGMERLRADQPLTLRLLREVHRHLLSSGRGEEKEPGEFRHSQNWIGGSRPGNALFVPPPPHEVMRCMGALEKFWHDMPERTPTIIKAALVHVQFETIHPFLDGNGRLGRLLIPLLLCYEKALAQPLLYLSLYFKQHRSRYYELLQSVRTEGDWEAWLLFFLDGVEDTADQATRSAQRIYQLERDERSRLEGLGRASLSALRLHGWVQRHLLFSAMDAAAALDLSHPAIMKSIRHLQDLTILTEISGRQRKQVFAYRPLLDILSEGTEKGRD
jgi:Fic family protein